jgi:hypothetical protein
MPPSPEQSAAIASLLAGTIEAEGTGDRVCRHLAEPGHGAASPTGPVYVDHIMF